MPRPRHTQVSLEATPYYHCVSRCVRRAYLCGINYDTKENYEHRRSWVEQELLYQAQVFAIDIAAYAIMSNHYHVVLHINKKQAESWDFDTVIERWHALFKGNVLSQRYLTDPNFSDAERHKLAEYVEEWRNRLMDLGWFMRRLNEKIARQANYEDQCTGRFWEGRFKSQALLDEQALAACMAYVDLNPIRVQIAKTSEQSDHTSIQVRCKQAKHAHSPNHPQQQAKRLLPFVGNPRQDMPDGLPFRLTDYVALVELTGLAIRNDKKGYIEKQAQPILQRLGIQPENWMTLTKKFEDSFKHFVGTPQSLTNCCITMNRQRRSSYANSQALFA